MELRKVKSFELTNQGGFVCDIHCIYYDQNGSRKGNKPNHENFPLGQSRTMDLESKIPELENGDLVQMSVWVEAGNDNTYPTMFQFDAGGEELQFTISGTTLDNRLGLNN